MEVLILRRARQSKSKKTKTDSEKRAEFRQTQEWKDFRKALREEQKIDPVTQSKLTPTANCHHIDQRIENYSNLDPERFVMLNKKTHTVIHFLFTYYKKYGEQVFVALHKILDKMLKYSSD